MPQQRAPGERRIGLARRLSKLGVCSRSQAEALVRAGRVALAGRVERDPEYPTLSGQAIRVDGRELSPPARSHLMLNKPRGLTTSTSDERGRDTVYRCLQPQWAWPQAQTAAPLPWLAPVGRLDRASEGLLLFSNDPEWAAAISAAASVHKTYHVRIECPADAALLTALRRGVIDQGETLAVIEARLLRPGPDQRSRWLELVLDEGRNRHIRRLLAALEHKVQRLVRVAIGPLPLGELPKGHWRWLSDAEVAALAAQGAASAGASSSS